MVGQVFLSPSPAQGGVGVVLVQSANPTEQRIVFLQLETGEQKEMSYGRRKESSLSSIMGGEARDLLVGPLPNIKETLTWQGQPWLGEVKR